MSWIEKLFRTYDNCKSQIGKINGNNDYVLLPICHTSQNAQIEVILDCNGAYKGAVIVPKNGKQQTILPATEGSAGRAGSKLAPLSLGDKLQYIAKDYEKYRGEKKPGFEKYIARLERWATSSYSTIEIKIVLEYLKKGNLITDLIKERILDFDTMNQAFPSVWNGTKEEKPEIYSVLQGAQLDCLVRFIVEIPGQSESRLWRNPQVWNSWTKYYLNNKIVEDNFDIEDKNHHHSRYKTVFCYVEGKKRNFAGNHPAKIRNAGDGAKLISSNDTSGFTFRGRFLDDEQACTIGYEVSQKAHNALRWLIAKQGYRDGDLAIVAWAPKGIELPPLLEDSFNIYGEVDSVDEIPFDTAEYTGRTLAKKLAGYSLELGVTDDIVVMGINSATPGRLSISYYRELTGSEFLSRINKWHRECAWLQHYSKGKIYYGAPAPKDIAWAAFGTKLGTTGNIEIDDKIKRQTIERILPCIVDGVDIPKDIVLSLIRSSTKRFIYEAWEWEKVLGITCAVYRYYEKEKRYIMALEKERTTRDYLFGRLLAVADSLEGFALSQTEKGRPTNAARLMQRFAEHPCSTWRTIELALSPYKARLGHKGLKYEKAMNEIMNSFIADDFSNDMSLSGEFLLGFHTQRSELMKKTEKEENKGEEI